nr:hypothetical protein OG409_34330 [Streptomyces sp. NBC_00974]
MVVVAVVVAGAALIAVDASRPGHHPAHHRGVPDAGPAVAAAVAGVAHSLPLLTPAFLMVGSAQDPAVARKGNHAEAGVLIDLSPADGRMPAPTRTGSRGRCEKYAHVVIEREWPKARHGATHDETRAMAYGPREPVAMVPPEAPPKAVDDSRDAVDRPTAQRRVRVEDTQGALP